MVATVANRYAPTYSGLLESRIRWKPYPLRYTEFPKEAEVSNAIDVSKRIIALGLELEIPVKEWIISAKPKELPISPTARELLFRNSGDEDIHLRAIKYAEQVYPISEKDKNEARAIADLWLKLKAHPIEIATAVETGVFLVGLAVWRVFGSQSLINLGNNISRDEQRHVATNRGVLANLGINFTKPLLAIEDARKNTLDWLFDGFNYPDLGIDKDFLMEESSNLIKDGYSAQLEGLTDSADYLPPFENSNSRMY